MIYVLFFFILLMLIGSYSYYNKNITHPCVLFFLVYSFSVLCAIFNVEKWNINLSLTTFIILLGGAVELLLVSIVFDYIFKKRNNKNKDLKKDNKKTLVVNNLVDSRAVWFTRIIVLYDIIMLAILIINIINIAASHGSFSSISEMLTVYKNATSYTTSASLPKYVTILMKPVVASAYLCYYIFIVKALSEKFKNKKELLLSIVKKFIYVMPVILYSISMFAQSNREGIMILLGNLFILSIILWYKKSNWRKEIRPIFIAKVGGICIIGLIVFFFSAKWVGRINDKGMFDYITLYSGGSIECLNQYVKDPVDIKIVRGEETFYNMIKTFDSFGITHYDIAQKMTVHKEFRYYNGEMIGNVYTAYRRWMHDYGIVGVFILQFVFSAVICYIYNLIHYTKYNLFLNNFIILLYSYLSYTIYLHFIDDYLFFDVLGQASFAVLACLIAGYYFICVKTKKLKKLID